MRNEPEPGTVVPRPFYAAPGPGSGSVPPVVAQSRSSMPVVLV